MNLLNQFKLPAIAGILLVVGFISSCEQDLTTIGEGVIGGEPFVTNKQTYNVFAFNKKIEAVQTNQLPIYQLGVFTDPVYGKTTASITSQVQLSVPNPTFGDFSQDAETNLTGSAIAENERIDSVLIYIPYQNNKVDTDGDGVVDALDGSPNDATNDDDNDGVPNNEEATNNTNPLDADTDGDGINDKDDELTLGERFAERFRLDSIYGDRTQPFNLKVEESTFFLRDLDPNTNFEDAQEYFSNQQFSPTFTDKIFFDGEVTISDKEILNVVQEDDPETEEDEEGTISSKQDPGIYVKFNETGIDFFQNNILNNEGSAALLSSANFKDFFKGIHISVTPSDENLMLLLDITKAKIVTYYTYDKVDGDTTEEAQKSFDLNLITQSNATPVQGNAINTFVNEDYPADITSAFSQTENASKIYLKGGAGSYAEVKLFDQDIDIANSIIRDIRANNWIINEANLVFYVDPDAFVANDIEPPRLYLYNAETNGALYNIATENNDQNNVTALGFYLNYDGILQESGGKGLKYSVKITEYINNLVVRDSTNATLGLTISPDIRIVGANNVMLSGGDEKNLPASSVLSPLGTVLFGSDFPDDNDKKLKLEIIYTETN